MQSNNGKAKKEDKADMQQEKKFKKLLDMQLSRDRWIALGLLLTVIILVFILFILPFINMQAEYSETKEDLVFRLHRYKRVIARKDAVFQNAEKIKQQHASQGYLSTQNTTALASADLQKFIKNAISSAGGELKSTQSMPSKDGENFTRVTVKVRMKGSIEALRNVLYEMETSTPIIIIKQLDIRPVRAKRNRKTRKIEPSNKMNINFQASSFMRLKS